MMAHFVVASSVYISWFSMAFGLDRKAEHNCCQKMEMLIKHALNSPRLSLPKWGVSSVLILVCSAIGKLSYDMCKFFSPQGRSK